MSNTHIGWLVLMTGGIAIVGAALARLIGGRLRPRAFAIDLLIGGAVAAAGGTLLLGGGMPVLMVSVAVLVAGLLLQVHEAGRQRKARELDEKSDRLLR